MAKQEPKDTPNSLVKHTPDTFDAFQKQIEQAEKIAEYVVNSDTFGDNFTKTTTELVDGEERVVKVKNKNDVIACILLGQSLGLNPMEAITLGNKINSKSYLQIKKGQALGLDLTSSLQNINIIPGKGGVENYYTNISVVQKAVLDTNTHWEVLEDYVLIHRIFDAKTGVFVADEFDDDLHFLVTSKTTAEDIKREKALNKVGVVKKEDRRTKIKFTRDRNGEIQESIGTFTLTDATEAELYRGHKSGFNEKGEPVTFFIAGKDNWNNRPRQMLFKQSFMIGARPVCADKLQGILEESELPQIIDTTATVVESNVIQSNPDVDNNINE